jgi:hypothetical protein
MASLTKTEFEALNKRTDASAAVKRVEIPGTPQSPQILVPAIALSAFASELFLKCLIAIETNANPPKGHDLSDFFKHLTPLTRGRLTQMWGSHAAGQKALWDASDKMTGQKCPRDLPSALELGKDSFEAMRYLYEKQQFVFNFHDLPHMLERRVLELRPEWPAPMRPAP